jgi:hypothetical protein
MLQIIPIVLFAVITVKLVSLMLIIINIIVTTQRIESLFGKIRQLAIEQ